MKTVTLKVKKAQVVTNLTGTDMISFELDSTSQYPEMKYESYASFNTRHGLGLQWVKENFPQLVGVIEFVDAKTGKRTVE